MDTIRMELVWSAINIRNKFEKQYEFIKQTILANEFLSEAEKSEAINLLNKEYDYNKLVYNEGIRRTCENCKQECLATFYCEHCVRNYLKAKFSNWTSGNNDIDNLIQNCQMETLMPNNIVEWIPYSNLKNIKYLTKGGFSETCIADWIDGHYYEWDSKEKQLKRSGMLEVILKKLQNVESANRSWFDEVCYFHVASFF
jgi:hypothetical protein